MVITNITIYATKPSSTYAISYLNIIIIIIILMFEEFDNANLDRL